MQLLKLSTAATVVVGPVLDADGAAVTTATVTDFSIAKNGTIAALTTETVTHSVNGYYTIALTTSNTNTLGRLDIITNDSAMSMANHRYNVLPADTYEELLTTGIADAVLGQEIESNLSMLQAQRLQSAILGALISGAGSGTEVFKAARNAATTRVTVTVDQSGNRTNIAYNLD